MLRACSTGPTPSTDRAVLAARSPWRANRRAQFHQSLVPRPRRARSDRFDQRLGRPLQIPPNGRLGDIALLIPKPRQHAHDIPVHRGKAPAEGDGGKRRGRVLPEARQRSQLGIVGWETAAFPGDKLLCRRLHLSRPSIVPQPAPGFEQALLRGRGQAFERRETFEKAFVIRDHRRDSRLLQHYFGKPDAIGVFGVSPGQVALMAAIPSKQSFGKRSAHCRGKPQESNIQGQEAGRKPHSGPRVISRDRMFKESRRRRRPSFPICVAHPKPVAPVPVIR